MLRHSCVTRLIEQGVSVPVVQRFAGHADDTTTMRYCSVASDVYADEIRAALSPSEACVGEPSDEEPNGLRCFWHRERAGGARF